MDPVTIDISSAITSAVTVLTEQVGGMLPTALGIGAAILAATIGWKVFKRFVRG